MSLYIGLKRSGRPSFTTGEVSLFLQCTKGWWALGVSSVQGSVVCTGKWNTVQGARAPRNLNQLICLHVCLWVRSDCRHKYVLPSPLLRKAHCVFSWRESPCTDHRAAEEVYTTPSLWELLVLYGSLTAESDTDPASQQLPAQWKLKSSWVLHIFVFLLFCVVFFPFHTLSPSQSCLSFYNPNLNTRTTLTVLNLKTNAFSQNVIYFKLW